VRYRRSTVFEFRLVIDIYKYSYTVSISLKEGLLEQTTVEVCGFRRQPSVTGMRPAATVALAKGRELFK